VAAVDDITRSSAVCASEFGREDGGGVKGSEPGSDLSSGVEVSVTSSRSSVFERNASGATLSINICCY
jgi:hypothetical protein